MPLYCHPEHIRSTQCKLREGSIALGSEMLRCAQHDSTVTYDEEVKVHIHIRQFLYTLNCFPRAHPSLHRRSFSDSHRD
jgi:hypothetical protein